MIASGVTWSQTLKLALLEFESHFMSAKFDHVCHVFSEMTLI